jgi:hypothetical protein
MVQPEDRDSDNWMRTVEVPKLFNRLVGMSDDAD